MQMIEDYIYLVSPLEFQYHAKVAFVLKNKCSFLDIMVLSSKQQPLEGTVCKKYQTIKIKFSIVNIRYSRGFIFLLHECTQNNIKILK